MFCLIICERFVYLKLDDKERRKGETKKLEEVENKLKNIGIEAPRVFKKTKGRGLKRNYDIAILVSGW